MARFGQVRLGKAGRDWHVVAATGEVWRRQARNGMAGTVGVARLGWAWIGNAGVASSGIVGTDGLARAWQARRGDVGQGADGQHVAMQAGIGSVGRVAVRYGVAG